MKAVEKFPRKFLILFGKEDFWWADQRLFNLKNSDSQEEPKKGFEG